MVHNTYTQTNTDYEFHLVVMLAEGSLVVVTAKMFYFIKFSTLEHIHCFCENGDLEKIHCYALQLAGEYSRVLPRNWL